MYTVHSSHHQSGRKDLWKSMIPRWSGWLSQLSSVKYSQSEQNSWFRKERRYTAKWTMEKSANGWVWPGGQAVVVEHTPLGWSHVSQRLSPVPHHRRSSPNWRGTESWAAAVGTASRRMHDGSSGRLATTSAQSSQDHSSAGSVYNRTACEGQEKYTQ